MKNKIVAWLLVLVLIWSNRNTPLLDASATEIVVCLMLLGVCAFPAVRWLRDRRKGLPLFELYCAMHALYYLQPYVDGNEQLAAFPESARVLAAFATVVFLSSATLVFLARTRRPISTVAVSPILRRYMPSGRESWFWLALAVWLGYNWAITIGVFPNVGGWRNLLTSTTTAAGTIAVSHLFFAIGAGRLSRGRSAVVMLVLIAGVLTDFASGYLVAGTLMLLVAFVSFTVASRRLPIVFAATCLLAINFLHLGKAEMRGRFWSEGTSRFDPFVVFPFWVNASWARLTESADENAPSARVSIVSRASLAQMLATAVDRTPGQLPYLGGTTYWQIPSLIVPRFIDPEKPSGNLPSETLAIYYGFQTTESIARTSIGLGQIAEAWANFGWFGVVIVGAFFGWLFSIPARLTRSIAPDTLGYLASSVMLIWAADLEHGLGTFLVSLLQTTCMAAALLYAISIRRAVRPAASRRCASPLALGTHGD